MATAAQQLPRYRHTLARTRDWAGSRHVYRPRRPTATPLYPVVQHHLETFLAQATESDPMGHGVPSWVEKDLRAYLRCGIDAEPARPTNPARIRWAVLLARIYEVLPLLCPGTARSVVVAAP